MLRKLAVLICLGCAVAGCGDGNANRTRQVSKNPGVQSDQFAQDEVGLSAEGASQFSVDDFVVGEPIRFQNLTIFPVSSRTPRNDDRFITLDEGLKSGTIEIREVGAAINAVPANPDDDDETVVATERSLLNRLQRRLDGNDVNSLVVVNNDDKPLYLMPGEIIIGGSQDRTIGGELVIAPDKKPTRIPVFCVEHGRWGAKGAQATMQQLMAASRTTRDDAPVFSADSLSQSAAEADKGKFVASVGQLTKAARVAVQSDKEQSAVWERVAELNARARLAPTTGAFTANYCDDDSIKRIEPFLNHYQDKIAGIENVVGVLVAVNDKIESMDVFESTPLFQKVWPKLLKSSSLDAINSKTDSAEKRNECSREDAVAFITESMQANVSSNETSRGLGLVKRDGQHVLSFTAHAPNNDTSIQGGAMGGMGGGVHFSGFSK